MLVLTVQCFGVEFMFVRFYIFSFTRDGGAIHLIIAAFSALCSYMEPELQSTLKVKGNLDSIINR